MPLESRPTHNINNPIDVRNGITNIDYRYGPYISVEDALDNLIHVPGGNPNSSLRRVGRTVLVIENDQQIEYWFKNGVEDHNLVRKTNKHFGVVTSTLEIPINPVNGDRMVITEEFDVFKKGSYYYNESLEEWAQESAGETIQDDTNIVKFDKNYNKFYYDDAFTPQTLIDPVTELPYDVVLELYLEGAVLGNSVQMYVSGEIPFEDNPSVKYQNKELYDSNNLNLLVLDYKSDTDITAVVITDRKEEIEFPEEVLTYISATNFTGAIKFDKPYEIGNYTDRVDTFSIDTTDAKIGTINTIFFNATALPTISSIKWVNNSNNEVFISGNNCLIVLYYSATNEIIGNIINV